APAPGPVPLRDGSSAAVLRLVRKLAPRLAGLISRSPPRTSRTSPATRFADMRYGAPRATMRSCFVRRGSTGQCLVVDHSPRLSTAAHFGSASACVPTDDDAATRPVDPAVPSKAARSPESDLPPAASESTPHLADRVSVFVVRRLESVPDDRLGIRSRA